MRFLAWAFLLVLFSCQGSEQKPGPWRFTVHYPDRTEVIYADSFQVLATFYEADTLLWERIEIRRENDK